VWFGRRSTEDPVLRTSLAVSESADWPFLPVRCQVEPDTNGKNRCWRLRISLKHTPVTVADMNGVLRRSMSDAVRGRRPDQLSPYEAALRGFGHADRLTPEEHQEVRDILEQAVRAAPGASDCWAMLSIVYINEFSHDFNLRSDPLGRAFEAARRAMDAGPTNQIAHYARSHQKPRDVDGIGIGGDRAASGRVCRGCYREAANGASHLPLRQVISHQLLVRVKLLSCTYYVPTF